MNKETSAIRWKSLYPRVFVRVCFFVCMYVYVSDAHIFVVGIGLGI